jgi:predicted  nucleic acid-binding Zn-ribbon protein
MKQEIVQVKKKIQENLNRTMEEIMNMNQAKTDAKFKDLTETIERTQLELYTAKVSFDARTRNLQKVIIDTQHELQIG